MYSMSFFAGQANTLQGFISINEGDRFGTDAFHDNQLHVTPYASAWESSIHSLRMVWEDGRNEISTFESFEHPFVFDDLPTPALGMLRLRLEALDASGQVLPGSDMDIQLVVAAESDPIEQPAAETVLLQVDESPMAALAVTPDSFSPLRIQAEDADASDGAWGVISGPGINVVSDPVLQPNAVNADGQAYVDYGDGINGGETLTFTFSVAEAGEYELGLGYALSQNDDGSDRNRPLRLDVNGELVDRMFDLPSTTLNATPTDFSEFGERTIRVQLEAGENTVTFTSNGASGPNVDYLEVRAPNPDVYVIQGEDLVLSPTVDNDNSATNRVVTVDNIADFTNGSETFRVGAEGASYLDWALNNANAYGEFSLEVATAGTYSVTVTYASSSGRPLDLSLVDSDTTTPLGTFNFAATAEPGYYPDDVSDVPTANQPAAPTSGNPTRQTEWEGWSTETIEITLDAGSNTLRLGGGTNGPNIDKIEVALLEAAPPAATVLLSVADADPIIESGDEGVTTLNFALSASDDFSGDVELALDIDGVAETRTVTFTDGVATLTVDVANDAEDNGTETVAVTLTGATGDGFAIDSAAATATGSVSEDDEELVVPADPIRLQAEDFDGATTFTVENIAAADGGQAIRMPGNREGTASYSLDGKVPAGTYTIIVGYIDENDGESTAQLSIGNAEGESFSGSWVFDDDANSGNGTQIQNFRTVSFTNVTVGEGATLSLSANSTALEYARIDYFEFVLTGSVDPDPNILLSISDADPIVENGDTGVTTLNFALSASDAFSGDVELALDIDGAAETRTVTFTDGVATLAVDVANDDENNGTDTIEVTLTGVTGEGFAIDSTAATATGSISEDDGGATPGEPIRLQAEDFDSATTFTVENIAAADGGQAIRMPGSREGTASYSLDGKVPAGTYTVIVGYIDENDGESTAQLSIGNAEGESFSGSWVFDDDAESGNGTQIQNFRTVTFTDVTVGDGATLSLSANSTALEYARIDYFEFVPTGSVDPEPTILLGITDADSMVENGDTGVTTLNFALSASDAFSGDVELALDIDGVTETRTVTFTDGVATLAVDVANDDEDNGTETVAVTLTGATGEGFVIDSAAATATGSVSEDDTNDVIESFTLQGEDAIVTDVGGTAQGAVTRAVDANNPDDFGNYREGAVGGAYMDFGTDAGDQVTFNIDAPSAGTYTATIRYANGGTAPRPLDLAVNGAGQPQVAFANAPNDGVNDPWDAWLEQEIQVTLEEGANTLTLTIPTAANGGVANGPNIDQIVFDFNDGETPPAPFAFEIQGEALTIDDDEPTPDTVVRDASNPETNAEAGPDGLWDGYTGTGYLDMGNEAGDAAFFDVAVEEAGTYTLTVRYANAGGNGADRPMDILIGGVSQGSIAFAATGVDAAGWQNWTDATIEVELEAGSNTIRLENVGNSGPNIDSLSVTREGFEPPPVVEPIDRFSVKINFQPEGVAVPEGYIADNGKAFGTQSVTIDGQTYQYGWVTEASIYDDEPGTTPLDISELTNVAVNDRTGDIAGLDPRQGTYAHFDQPGSNYVRAGWEIELEDGYYEVTISIGDTSGPYDSRNVINAEGELFNDPFTPFRPDDFPVDNNPGDDTEGARSDLVTRIVQVTDGRLTLDSMGLDNENTEIQYIEIQSLPDLTPNDGRAAPEDYAFFTDARAIAGVGQNEVEVDLDPEDGAIPTGVDPTSDIFVGISVVDGRGGALLESLNDGSVKLFETVTGEEVSFNVNTTGGFDSLTISPSGMLKPFTSYTLVIDGFQDRGPNDDASAPTREFQKYTNTFVTGEAPEVVPRDVAFNDVVELNGAADNAFGFTSLEITSDGSTMYVATIGGQILRFDIDPSDGSLVNRQELSLPSDYFFEAGVESGNDRRGIIGLTVDPTDSNVLWITDNYPIPLNGRDNGVPEFSGRVTKITLDGGSDFSGVAEPYITGLPRSNGDHVTNSLEFRANPDYDAATNPDVPTHLLYLIQGSNSAMGEPDSAWGNRPERLLNAAVMEIDPTRDAPPGGFDVSTEPVPNNGQNTRYDDPDGHPKDDPIPMGNGEFLVFDERGVATVQDADGNVLQSFYDPYAEDAVLTIFATGARNAYDLVWHSNGFLYVPTNGSAAGGNVPDDPSTPENERYTNVEKQDDYLFKIVEGGYYGHPNPLRDEYIMNGGNPTGGSDPNQVDRYPVGTNPEGTYDISGVYSLGENRSPNGAVEYTSGVFGGNLQGNVLFTEYSGGDDIRSITLDANGNVIGDDVLRDPNGNVISYVDPLDIIENPVTGQLYLLTLNRGNGQSQIIRLDPAPGGVVDPVDPEPGDLESLLIIQAEDKTPDDGTAVTIATGAGAQIQIRDVDNRETTEGLPNGLRPGSFGVDGNTNDNDGVLGGYADFGSTNVDFLTFTFDLSAAQAGESVLRLRYANGGDANRPLEVFVNNVSVGVFDFSPPPGLTGDAAWAEWLTEDVAATLVSGQNTVRLQATANTGPNIDQLEILRGEPDTTPDVTQYEAEGATLDGAVVVLASNDDRNASGDGFVDFDGTGDQTITWTIDVSEAGSYDIGFRYALGAAKADRPLGLTINGVDLGQLNFEGQSNAAEDNWFFQNALVTLQAGSNTITLTAPNAVGPNIDLLKVPNAPTDNFVPVYADVSDGSRIELESGDSARTINELTADFYFTVDADGLYRLDLAANAGGDDGQGLTLTLNGQAVKVLAYPGVGEAGEEGAYVELKAGVEYNLRAVSTADGADDLDYLDVTPVAGNDNADIAVQSGDAAYFSDRLHFSYLENNSASNTNRDFKESATVTISNTGSDVLQILDADIEGPFVLEDPSVFEGLTLAAGQSLEVTVLFDRASYTAPTNDAGDGVFEGRIRLVTNDADSPVAEIHMAGFWQARDEGGWEPNVNEVWEVFGFGNRIDGLTTVGGGENSVLNDFDLYRPVNDDEVMSRYWALADGAGEAKITQLAAYHGDGGATLGIHNPGNKNQDIIFSNHAGDNNQSLLPVKSDGQFSTASFSLADIPGSWAGQGVFGIEVANLSTDPSLNPQGGGTPPADAEGIERGYTVRMFRALDANGNVIPNTYLGIMDYTGINYDYNDNMFLIEGVTPVTGGELTVINNDGVPSNDRLVMSRIENPANAAQVVHDEVTITLRNDGFEALDINGIEVSDTTLFELTQAFSAVTLEPGEAIDVTVRFIANDPNDASLYEASLIITSSDADEGEKVIQLAGLAQNQSESGQEPLVQEIINAFGYTTNVAEGQMNKGGLVEANGDEILAPYFQRAEGSSPIKITQLAAYHTQGDVARLFIHDVDSRNRDEILAHDEADGQTLLPRTLNNGNQLTTTTLDRDAPFGFFAEISGRQGYISWSDPDANLYEDTVDAIGNPGTNLNWDANDGHLIRVYIAKDAAGNVIPDTYIVIQDYAGVNYDYNDNIFLVENVTPYDPAGAEDADGNGRVDLYDDDNNDGIPNFLDNPEPTGQTAFNASETAWVVGSEGLALQAKLYDNGGQGVAYNDTTPGHQGASFRSDEAVDISIGTEALGYIADGEWVEYTLNVETAGTYTLSFSTSATSGGKTITAAFEQDGGFYTPAQVQNLPNTGSFTSFQTVGPLTFELEEGEQVLRLTFNGGQLDLASFNLDFVAPADDGQSAYNDTQTAWEVGADGLTLEARFYDNGGQGVAYNDSDAAHQGSSFRSDEGVDISTPSQAIGFIENGEWVEYTINVAEDGVYDLGFLTSMASTNSAARSITASFAKGDMPYVTASPVGVSPTGSWTTFTPTATTQVALEAGEQVLRLTFNGGSMDLASFNLAPVDQTPANQAPVVEAGIDDVALVEGEAISFSLPADAFIDADGDSLTYTASGLPSGISMSSDGVFSGTATAAGSFDIIVTASDGQASVQTGFTLAVDEAPVDDGQRAFTPNGEAWLVGGNFSLKAANYDEGGQGVAYNDADDYQIGTEMRPGDGVDIVGNGDAIGWVDEGEWVEYTLNIQQAGVYDLSFLSALGDAGGSQRSITATFTQGDGMSYASSGPVVVSPTGGWGNFQPTDASQVALEAGEQVLRLTFNGGSMDLASFTLSRDGQQAFNAEGTPWLVDANEGLTLDAVNYDEGGQGVAYNDADAYQIGTEVRPGDGVDIVGEGEAVGWVDEGEWLEYTINVEQAGSHTLSFVTSSPDDGRTITAAVEQNGGFYAQASGSVPNSGDWGVYVDGPSLTLDLEEGVQVLRITFNGGSMDLASFQITRDAGTEAASASSVGLMMAMASEANDASYLDEEVAALSDDVSISGVQEDAQGALM
nr:carbohydrate-binding protein [Halomonas sp.]